MSGVIFWKWPKLVKLRILEYVIFLMTPLFEVLQDNKIYVWQYFGTIGKCNLKMGTLLIVIDKTKNSGL